MYSIKGRTTTTINDEQVTRTYYASTSRKDNSDSAKVTAQMEAKAKAERKAWGRRNIEEEV